MRSFAMSHIYHLFSIILVAGAIQAFFLVAVILRSNYKSKHVKYYLAVHLFLFALFIILPEVYKYYYHILPHLTASYFPIILLLGPTLYFYVISLIDQQNIAFKTVCLHFLPSLVNYIYLIPLFYSEFNCKNFPD